MIPLAVTALALLIPFALSLVISSGDALPPL